MTEKTSPSPVRFTGLSDDDLLELLFTAGDCLPRAAAEEFLRRGPRMLPPLYEIVADKTCWTRPVPEWWAPVHASYLLGAMEVPDALIPLLTALRWADAFDCDWVTEDLPSMFGRLGPVAFEALGGVVADASAGGGARAIALASMAAVTLDATYLRAQLLEAAAEWLRDFASPLYLRQTAAQILADFRSQRHHELLREFGREEAHRRAQDPEYSGVFYDWEVDELLDDARGGEPLEFYRRDWMQFYEPEEIEARQERWRREQEEAATVPEPLPGAAAQPPALDGPCRCGSGRPFSHCCYQRVH